MTSLTLTQVIGLELRCVSEKAGDKFERLVLEPGHVWTSENEAHRVCGLLYQVVDPLDQDAKMSLVPCNDLETLADELVEKVVPKVVRGLERF